MKPASTELQNLLASREFFAADLYQFSLIGGGQLYYCSGDKDIVWNGITWSAGGSVGPYFERKGNRAKCHWKIGVEVDTLVFDILPGSSTINGTPFLSAIRQGVFDGAELTLYRAFMPTYGNVAAGTVIMFVGRTAEIDAGRSLATFSVNSHLELLNLQMPRNLYQAPCSNTLYDSGCALNKATYAVSGTVAEGSTSSSINATLAQASGYFDMGQIAFTSGALNGLSRSIKTYLKGSPGPISMTSPFPVSPSAGDSFTIYPGCDKTKTTCTAKFNNLIHFRGQPFIPVSETAI